MTKTQSRTKRWLAALAVATSLLPAGPLMAQEQSQPAMPVSPLIDWPMQADPAIVVPATPSLFHPKLAGLWMQALNRPDAQTRYEAALAIAKAQAMGMPGLGMMAHRLSTILADTEEHPATRLAAAQALVALDARDHAEALWQASAELGQEMARITAPALARWSYAPAVEAWRKDLAAADVSTSRRRLAIESLALAKDGSSASALHELAVREDAQPTLRLAAARAYATVASPATGKLPALPAADKRVGSVNALVRAHLLSAYTSAEAAKQLAALVEHIDPAVAALAGEALLKSAPANLDPHLDKLAQSGDAGLRRIAIERLILRADAAAAASLANLLGDAQPLLRMRACEGLVQLGKADATAPAVAQAVRRALQDQNPLALEQAALAAGEIGIAESAGQLMPLLDHASIPVGLAAATALRKLQQESTLEGALANVQKNIPKGGDGRRDMQAAQLIQLIGLLKYQPAADTLRKLVPKNSGPLESRRSAIWALGHLQARAEKPDTRLAADLVRRVNDTQGMEPEDDGVRVQSIIALGRVKAKAQLAALEKIAREEATAATGVAARWSIGQITGAQPAEPQVQGAYIGGWFLEPLD